MKYTQNSMNLSKNSVHQWPFQEPIGLIVPPPAFGGALFFLSHSIIGLEKNPGKDGKDHGFL
jgi:hypothetical protein